MSKLSGFDQSTLPLHEIIAGADINESERILHPTSQNSDDDDTPSNYFTTDRGDRRTL